MYPVVPSHNSQVLIPILDAVREVLFERQSTFPKCRKTDEETILWRKKRKVTEQS
jgi:hypothetical protein